MLEATSVLCAWLLGTTPDEDAGVGGPELDMAFCLNASAVLSPDSGGFTARTMPDLQSVPTEEKNL